VRFQSRFTYSSSTRPNRGYFERLGGST